MFKQFLVIIVAALLSGCVHTLQNLNSPLVPPKITMVQKTDSIVISVNMAADGLVTNPDHEFLKSVKKIALNIFSPTKEFIERFEFVNLTLNSQPYGNSSSSSELKSRQAFSKNNLALNDSTIFEFDFETNDGLYGITKTLKEFMTGINTPEDLGPALELSPTVENVTDSTLTFVLEATRKYPVEGEYIPNSEIFRVEILSLKGAIQWSSNHEANFLQAIHKVEPVEVNGVKKYTKDWNGMTIKSTKLPPGTYQARMTIPAKPKPYTTQIEFKWK